MTTKNDIEKLAVIHHNAYHIKNRTLCTGNCEWTYFIMFLREMLEELK
jgi:hypothetical protein